MTDEVTPDPTLVRAMAVHAAQAATEGRQRLLEEHSAAFRWLMASFLAINAGGLLTLKDFNVGAPSSKLIAAAAFYCGVVSALAIAWLGQRSARSAIEPMSQMSVFWAMTAEAGEVDQNELEKLNTRIAAVLQIATCSVRRLGLARVVHNWRLCGNLFKSRGC